MKLADLIPFLRRRTKSRHADDKAVDDFTRVVEQTGILKGPSAFDVAMNETRRDDVESWARLERGLKDDGL